ncbi:MAG: TIGR03862 family flavoprotein [Thiomicrospira sp.]|uniref:TIGR03862 family flavoprotein n=1 Tax=Thiomicrospira sp. TaxID=935 RepID=UPI0019FE21DF|nr:TIGR03862 family flavoprotein [Thiomicrospira sp.]MBE0492806.1 TIGR03862 family flavoprotein [Thiomicrospira sp.]
MKQIAIIGAGPGGLMAAEVLSKQPGLVVTVYDAMPSVGRKFLQAGRGGLNITHTKPMNEFMAAYGTRRAQIEPWIKNFGPNDIRNWVQSFGIDTFVGSSGRVYPQDMKAAPLLRKWLQRLREQGVQFAMRHHWQGWSNDGALVFQTLEGQKNIEADQVILALGGASWPHLGSDGQWVKYFEPDHITPLLPANCGFDLAWSAIFQDKFAGQPLKSVALNLTDYQGRVWHQKGECLITQAGIEGSLIYALSAPMRDSLLKQGQVEAYLDLMPDVSLDKLRQRLNKPRAKMSWSNQLKRAGLDAMRINLLRERLDANAAQDMQKVAHTLKHFELKLTAARPISEAISSAGGLTFESLSEFSELTTRPGGYAIGEMLDWEAPTGGYLLTAVLAQARYVAQHIVKQLA